MDSVIDYIMTNYTWIIVCSIIILLAIIGGYADKTNFGQGNNKSAEEDPDSKKNNLNPPQILPNYNDERQKKDQKNIVQQANNIPNVFSGTIPTMVNNQVPQNTQQMQSVQPSQSVQSTTLNNALIDINGGGITTETIKNSGSYNKVQQFNESFDKFDEEFNSILPQRDILDDGLLEDIENLSLDKTQKLDLSIPDLDDVELPKIIGIDKDQKKIWKK